MDVLRERWESQVQRGSAEDCWPWLGGIHRAGYGHLKLDRKRRWAHRLSWEFHFGPIPDGLYVLHRCDNPPCVNPSHLFLGTLRDNVLDMFAKGRARPRGGKLTAEKVAEIRALRGIESPIAIAEIYGVGASTIRKVLARTTWRHLP